MVHLNISSLYSSLFLKKKRKRKEEATPIVRRDSRAKCHASL
jgi:hypothetical protein